jgi:ApeA N-terminal domain 1
MDNTDFIGYWHFNSDKDLAYAGSLTNDLNGDFCVNLLGCENVPEKPYILYGTTASGKKITLYKCFTSTRRMSFPGIPSVEISAIYCFSGEHLSIESLNFNSAQIRFSSLNEWTNISGFSKFTNDDNSIELKYDDLDPIIFYNKENVKFILHFIRASPLFRPKHECVITQSTVILIKHDTKFSLDEFWDYITAIKSFFTLAYFSEPHIEAIKFNQDDNIIDCKYVGQDDVNSSKKVHRRDFLFEYKIIATDFEKIFNQWKHLNNIVKPVINVLQESFGNRNILSENKFLNLMQGIETFHRRTRQNEKESKQIHKEKMHEIISTCPDSFQDWLKSKLHFSNELSLHERLVQLFEEIDSSLKNHLFKDVEKLIKDSKNTRNYFTHYDKTLEKKALSGKELFLITEKLKIFLLIILLQETGINLESVNKIIFEGSQMLFNHLIENNE